MTKTPVVVSPDDALSTARAEMRAGRFSRLPVLRDGGLVGIITDRDVREHLGRLGEVKVGEVMTRSVLTVTPATRLEEAAQLMMTRKIGGLPVMDGDKLVGIVTTSDVIGAFLDVMGATEHGVVRVDIVLKQNGPGDLSEAASVIALERAEILGVGIYREKWKDERVFYLLVRTEDSERLIKALRAKGIKVLGTR